LQNYLNSLPGRVNHHKTSDFVQKYHQILMEAEGDKHPLKGIILLHALDKVSIKSADDLIDYQRYLIEPILSLTGESVLPEDSKPRLYIITMDAIAHQSPANGFAQSTLHGLIRTLKSEHRDLKPVVIDLPPDLNQKQIQSVILDEIISGETEEQVVVRENGRFVNRLAPKSVSTDSSITIRKKSSYLITGGLGEIGLKIATYLVSQGAGHLVLMGRTKPNAEVKARISSLEKTGAVIEIAHVDVTDSVAVHQLLNAVERPELRGIIHAAGTLSDGVLSKSDWQQFESVMRAKIMGTWNLHHATDKIELDFFILFSSIGSVFGPAAQGNYAAANAMLDQFAQYRLALGKPALSINWGPWSEIGLASKASTNNQVGAMKGINSMNPEQGIAVFDKIWSQSGQILAVNVNWPILFNYLSDMPLLNKIQIEQPVKTMESEKNVDWIQDLNSLPESEQLESIQLLVRNHVAAVLGNKAESLDVTAGFFDLGMDSLTSVELRNALQSSLGMELPSTLIFKYPNITAVTEYLFAEMNQGKSSEADTIEEPKTTSNSTAPSTEMEEMTEDELNALINDEFNNLMGD
jgi:acyl carrier protein